jgi:hypothetical protein
MKWSIKDLLNLASENFKPFQLNMLYQACKEFADKNKIPPTYQRMKDEKFMMI